METRDAVPPVGNHLYYQSHTTLCVCVCFVDFYYCSLVYCFGGDFLFLSLGTQLVMDLSKIRKHYLVSWFPIDLVAIVPFDFAMRAMNGTIRCRYGCYSLFRCVFSMSTAYLVFVRWLLLPTRFESWRQRDTSYMTLAVGASHIFFREYYPEH